MSSIPYILIIDDDEAVRKSIGLFLKMNGFKPLLAANPKEGIALLSEFKFSCVLLDMNFKVETTGDEGLTALQKIKKAYPELPVVLFTGWGNMQLAIEGMKLGASDFINKPWENDHLLKCIKDAITVKKNSRKVQLPEKSPSRKKLEQEYDISNIIGQDPQLLKVLETVGRVAKTNAPILIMGESGTGKELIAEAVHNNSPRTDHEFVKVNLGGISQSLFESEMFGHKKGSFTGAHTDREGRFSIADKGSIFLDEMGELDLSSQVKLLRVLQERKFEPLGTSKTQSADFRVISATNKILPDLVRENKFREDLFFRINLITVVLPPLRERKGDIPLLADHFLKLLETSYGITGKSFAPETLKWLQKQPLKGNIRELKNWVESSVLMTTNDVLEINDFENNPTNIHAFQNDEIKEEIVPNGMTLEEMEIIMIKNALNDNRFKIAPSAKQLGISRNALYRKVEKYNITDAQD
ncbi:sigma-54-dependent Fis family transcriptional regulator [Flammeovirga pectinis]|uniref:Sigma-54-dependent Fis family transcriptional regulator n=1 Tax=Flammeovirga pectinis TaxID=2494373 RepID=A0A3Q9FP78_9BACT|nr:sigma-54 dependent transcriptional regulator [Flammeovirga pectinis]AZQ64678.1 sigma-54-dependent Fis family transcriptional regulator [Flammeovirga pectinis]